VLISNPGRPAMPAKSAAYEEGIREGRAMAARSRNPEASEPEEEEEEEMDMAANHSRKRSAKGAKHTKPAKDGGVYGKKPMDAECGCGRKGKCDGNCGSMRKRSDSLTPLEYLDACELGIQDRSTAYIRARLDAAERLDLKCGKGSISEGEKCHVGPAQKVQPKSKGGRSQITLTGKETGILSRERIKREGYYGARLGGNAFSRKSQAQRYGAANAAAGAAIGGVAGALLTGNAKGAALGVLGGAAYGALAGAAGGAITAQVNRSTSRAANRSLQRERFEKPIASRYKTTRTAMKAGGATGKQLEEYDIKTAMQLARGYDRINQRTKGRYGRDSVFASGFSLDSGSFDI
jgi:hypothetical protein